MVHSLIERKEKFYKIQLGKNRSEKDFLIENGVLMLYSDNEQHIVIPEYGTSLGRGVF